MSSAGDTAMTRISEGLNSAAVIFARLYNSRYDTFDKFNLPFNGCITARHEIRNSVICKFFSFSPHHWILYQTEVKFRETLRLNLIVRAQVSTNVFWLVLRRIALSVRMK